MKKMRRGTPCTRFAVAFVLLLLFVSSWASPPALAQIGSLIVTITSPTSGSTVGGTINVDATASGIGGLTVRGVQFKLDGVNLGAEDTAAPYSVPWNTRTTSNGSHTLIAVARDGLGIQYNSDPVTVTVFNDTTPPTVTITSPANGATALNTITVSATAADNVGVAGVQFLLDGASLGAEDSSAPYAVTWNTTTASNGSHTLTARARDAAANTATSVAVTVTVSNDIAPPAVAITSPANGSTVSGSATVTASASDDVGVIGVQFLMDGAALGAEATTAPYAVTWNTTTASNGSHALTARARDGAGKTTVSAAVMVTVANTDTTPPTVSITAPASGATVSNAVTVSANASDAAGIGGVQFLLDGVALGTEDTTAPYAVSWDTTIATNGSHTLTARARDVPGNTATSAAVMVTVANATTVQRVEDSSSAITYLGGWTLNYSGAPGGWSGGTTALSFALGQRATLSFIGTGVSWIGFRGPQTGIANVYVDGTLVATVDPYASTETAQAVLFTTSNLASGSHTLAIENTHTKNPSSGDYGVVVDAFDVAGSGPDTTRPTVTINTPTAGSTVFGNTAVTANASDNIGVAGVQFFADGSPIGAEDTTAPYAATWDTTTVPDGSHTLTAVARDEAGNTATSAGITVTVSNAAPPATSTMTRFENTEPSIVYTDGTGAPGQPPSWWHGSRSRDWSGRTASFNRSAGARATFSFTGTAVNWIGFRAPWAGIARVYVDGAFMAEIDLYATSEQVQTAVFSSPALSAGPHTVAVESTGRMNAAASDDAVVVDAFDVAPAGPPPTTGTRVEETAQAVSYTAGWTQGDSSKAWSGGTAAATSAAGGRATMSFVGTTVSWVGLRSPGTGIARVYLDGSYQAEIDTFAPTEVQSALYSTGGLIAGKHTLAIEATGTKNAAATGSLVVVDAFDIQGRLEDTNTAFVYTGTWRTENADRAWSGTSANSGAGTAALSATAGSHADVTFTGTGVTWIGFRGSLAGIAEVWVDGISMGRIDLYAQTDSIRVPVYTSPPLVSGTHTLRIDVTGERNPAASNAYVTVDAVDVSLLPTAPAVTRLQDTDPAITYAAPGQWSQSDRYKYFSGEVGTSTTTAGATATVRFSTSAIRWVGSRMFSSGLARVSVDGVVVAQVDTRAAVQEEDQAGLFSVTGLAPGTHTLTIEVLGRNGEPAGATVERVWVDAFDIY